MPTNTEIRYKQVVYDAILDNNGNAINTPTTHCFIEQSDGERSLNLNKLFEPQLYVNDQTRSHNPNTGDQYNQYNGNQDSMSQDAGNMYNSNPGQYNFPQPSMPDINQYNNSQPSTMPDVNQYNNSQPSTMPNVSQYNNFPQPSIPDTNQYNNHPQSNLHMPQPDNNTFIPMPMPGDVQLNNPAPSNNFEIQNNASANTFNANPPEQFSQNQRAQTDYQPVPEGMGNIVPVSNLSGNKKALLIGINYYNTKFRLKGCINDANNLNNFLTTKYHFQPQNIVRLTDDHNDPTRLPTRNNIIQAMYWLVQGAQPDDSLFFHFSGHGSQVEDEDGDESDGFDETICPLDFQQAGMIVDDMMNDILVKPLPQKCRLTAIFDCCHSGTALDLPYIYSSKGVLKSFNPGKEAVSTLVSLGQKSALGDVVGAVLALKGGVEKVFKDKKLTEKNRQLKGGLGDVIMFSGCKDDQTSADVANADIGNTGAMSAALIQALNTNPYGFTYLDLLVKVRAILKEKKFTQLPQISTARPMDMNAVFRM